MVLPAPALANPSFHCCRLVYAGVAAVVLYCTESVHRREEGSTGKYQHEVEGVQRPNAGISLHSTT